MKRESRKSASKASEIPLPHEASKELPVRVMYSLGRCHVVNSGNLWLAVNILLNHSRECEKPEFTACATWLDWMMTGNLDADRKAVIVARRLLKDAIAFGFIELVYPRTRPATYRWLGTVVNGEIAPNIEAWHRQCAETQAKIASARRLARALERQRQEYRLAFRRLVVARAEQRSPALNNS